MAAELTKNQNDESLKNIFFQKRKVWTSRTQNVYSRSKTIFEKSVFSIKIGKTELSFLINGFANSSKYQRIHFNEFYDKIVVANNFT